MFQTTKQMIFDVNVNFMSLMMVEHPPNQNSLHRTSILWQSVRSGSVGSSLGHAVRLFFRGARDLVFMLS